MSNTGLKLMPHSVVTEFVEYLPLKNMQSLWEWVRYLLGEWLEEDGSDQENIAVVASHFLCLVID